jgi:hypothetical protein
MYINRIIVVSMIARTEALLMRILPLTGHSDTTLEYAAARLFAFPMIALQAISNIHVRDGVEENRISSTQGKRLREFLRQAINDDYGKRKIGSLYEQSINKAWGGKATKHFTGRQNTGGVLGVSQDVGLAYSKG